MMSVTLSSSGAKSHEAFSWQNGAIENIGNSECDSSRSSVSVDVDADANKNTSGSEASVEKQQQQQQHRQMQNHQKESSNEDSPEAIVHRENQAITMGPSFGIVSIVVGGQCYRYVRVHVHDTKRKRYFFIRV
jgi:alpha-galactosidase